MNYICCVVFYEKSLNTANLTRCNIILLSQVISVQESVEVYFNTPYQTMCPTPPHPHRVFLSKDCLYGNIMAKCQKNQATAAAVMSRLRISNNVELKGI